MWIGCPLTYYDNPKLGPYPKMAAYRKYKGERQGRKQVCTISTVEHCPQYKDRIASCVVGYIMRRLTILPYIYLPEKCLA